MQPLRRCRKGEIAADAGKCTELSGNPENQSETLKQVGLGCPRMGPHSNGGALLGRDTSGIRTKLTKQPRHLLEGCFDLAASW